jgi:PAS domain S-box-containing protein
MDTDALAMNTNRIGKILVVDDEIELKNILVQALTTHGYEVSGFTSGVEALALLREESFDLLLTDLMMPVKDGFALLREGLEIDPHLIVIMTTGQGTIQTAVDAMKLGAFDYVLKPFRLQALLPVLTRAMNARHLRLENLQLRETVAIYEMAQTIAFTFDPQTIISKLADAAVQQTDADEVSILLPTGEANEFYVAAVRGENRQRLLGERVSLKHSISGWVARERLPLMLDGEVNDERFQSLWPHPEIRSALSVPMQVANKLIGTININALHRPRPFNLGQMKALTILASTAAAALESASLYEQVRKAEENYRTIFENAIEGLFRSTDDGRYLAANPALARILGYESAADILDPASPSCHTVYVDPRDRLEAARLQKERGVVQGFEFQAYRKNGEKIWLSLNRREVRNQDGELFFEGSVEDITERKRIEEEQRTTRDQYESLVHSIDGIVWELDLPSLAFTFVSPQAERLVGYPPEMWLSEPDFWIEHLHPDDRRWVVDYCNQTAALGHDHEFDYRMIAADGRVVWFRDIVTVDKSDSECVRLRGVMVDITERKRAEDELMKSEERYRDLVENAHDIIYEHDLDGNYTAANKAGEQITGYTLAETLELNTSQTIAPEFVDKARQMLKRKLAGESVTAYELDLIAKDGRRVAVEVNTRLLFDDGGAPVGVQGIARDVTERKQLSEQLRQSQKLEAVGQLAGGIAHDFNNLLTVIGGYSDLVLRRLPRESPLVASVAEIKKAGDRASGLTRQLLAFSRKQILQPAVLDLNSLISNLEKMLSRLIGEDIDLLTIAEPNLGQVKADPGQIEQVIINLIVNARDAMPCGGIITIQTGNVELSQDYCESYLPCTPGKYIMLSVSDNGTGMDAKTQERIFDPFFTTKAAGKGTGLGLSTAYGIVKQSGGNIWVYSEVEKGTTFKIYLPRVDEESEIIASGNGLHPAPSGTETILLVEDEEQVRQIAEQILSTLGYNVIAACHGEEGLSVAEQYPGNIDLTITDVVMPHLSGREMIERLAPLRPKMKVLYMSGYTDDAIVRHGLLDKRLEFIQKPFAADAFARKIRSVLDSAVELAE